MPSTLCAKHFHQEAAAYAFVEARLWPEGPVCPHCGAADRIYAIKPNTARRVRMGLKKCGGCGRQFTVKIGTIFEGSVLPLHTWLQGLALLCCSKKGFSSYRLASALNISRKAARSMIQRVGTGGEAARLGWRRPDPFIEAAREAGVDPGEGFDGALRRASRRASFARPMRERPAAHDGDFEVDLRRSA